jgi:type IV secretory pathway TrbL component
MKTVKTARGRTIDMAALIKANEEMRAVAPGNVNMNARGDHLDKSGNVTKTVQAKSRAARDTTSAPEKRRLSDVPGAPEKPKKELAPEASAKATGDAERIIRQTEKKRDDGSRYLEIEFEDGSIQTAELDD